MAYVELDAQDVREEYVALLVVADVLDLEFVPYTVDEKDKEDVELVAYVELVELVVDVGQELAVDFEVAEDKKVDVDR